MLWLQKSSLLLCFLLASTAVYAQAKIDRIIIEKKARTMELVRAGQVLKTYKIALGGEPVGAKTMQGDHRTPEGDYVINSRNAHSQFHRSLHISYPNAADRERARKLGVAPGVTFTSTDCQMDTVSSGPPIVPAIGLTAASR